MKMKILLLFATILLLIIAVISCSLTSATSSENNENNNNKNENLVSFVSQNPSKRVESLISFLTKRSGEIGDLHTKFASILDEDEKNDNNIVAIGDINKIKKKNKDNTIFLDHTKSANRLHPFDNQETFIVKAKSSKDTFPLPWYVSLPCILKHGCVCDHYRPFLDVIEMQWYGTCTSCEGGFVGWNCNAIKGNCHNDGHSSGGDNNTCVCGDEWTGARCGQIQCIHSKNGVGPNKIRPTSEYTNVCDKCEEGWGGLSCDRCEKDSVCKHPLLLASSSSSSSSSSNNNNNNNNIGDGGENKNNNKQQNQNLVCHQGLEPAGYDFNMACNLTGDMEWLMTETTYNWVPAKMWCHKPSGWANQSIGDGSCYVSVFRANDASHAHPGFRWTDPYMYCTLKNCNININITTIPAVLGAPPAAATYLREIVTNTLYLSCFSLGVIGLLASSRFKQIYGIKLLIVIGMLISVDILISILFDHMNVVTPERKTVESRYICEETACDCAAGASEFGESCRDVLLGQAILPFLQGTSIVTCNVHTGACSIKQQTIEKYPILLANCTASSCINASDVPPKAHRENELETTNIALEVLPPSVVVFGLLFIVIHFFYSRYQAKIRCQEFEDILINQFHDGYSAISNSPAPNSKNRESNSNNNNNRHHNIINQSSNQRVLSSPNAADLETNLLSPVEGDDDNINNNRNSSQNNNNIYDQQEEEETAQVMHERNYYLNQEIPTLLRIENGSFDIPQSGMSGVTSAGNALLAKAKKTKDFFKNISSPTTKNSENNNKFPSNSNSVKKKPSHHKHTRSYSSAKTPVSENEDENFEDEAEANNNNSFGGRPPTRASYTNAALGGTIDAVPTISPRASHVQTTAATATTSTTTTARTRVLDNIKFQIESGESLAIMGPSGAAKTTLLDLLAYHRKAGTVGGDLSVNGNLISAGGGTKNDSSSSSSSNTNNTTTNTNNKNNASTYRSVVGFVPQEDCLIEYLTVRQCIFHAARLRLPLPISDRQINRLVDEVMQELALTECQHTIIGGSNLRGISGGEKKRAACACELVGMPRVLILDELTTGLDSISARRVMQLVLRLPSSPLKSLSKFGRFFRFRPIVIFSIHQPSADIYNMFDKVMVLVSGVCVVAGSAKTALQECLSRVGLTEKQAIKSMQLLGGGAKTKTTTSSSPQKNNNNSFSNSPNAAAAATTTTNVDTTPQQQSKTTTTQQQQQGISPTDSADERAAVSAAVASESRTHHHQHQQEQDNNDNGNDKENKDDYYNPAELLLHVATAHVAAVNTRLGTNVRASAVGVGVENEEEAKKMKESFTLLNEMLPSKNNIQISTTTTLSPKNLASNSSSPSRQQVFDASQMNNNQQQPSIVPPHIHPDDVLAVTEHMSRFYPTFWYQFWFVARRSRDSFIGMFPLTSVHITAAVFLAFLFSYLYHQEGMDLPGTEDKAGMITFLLLIVAFSSLSCLELLVSEWKVFAMDYDRGLYGVVPYFLVKCFFDYLPHRILPTAILAVGTYFPMGLRLDGSGIHFLVFLVVLLLFSIWNVSLCLCVGLIFGNFGSAALVSALIILWNTAFGGLLIQASSIPKIFGPFRYLSPQFFAYEATLLNELTGRMCLFDPQTSTAERAKGVSMPVECEEFLLNLGLNPEAFVRDMVALGGGTLLVLLLAVVFMKISASLRTTA